MYRYSSIKWLFAEIYPSPALNYIDHEQTPCPHDFGMPMRRRLIDSALNVHCVRRANAGAPGASPIHPALGFVTGAGGLADIPNERDRSTSASGI